MLSQETSCWFSVAWSAYLINFPHRNLSPQNRQRGTPEGTIRSQITEQKKKNTWEDLPEKNLHTSDPDSSLDEYERWNTIQLGVWNLLLNQKLP